MSQYHDSGCKSWQVKQDPASSYCRCTETLCFASCASMSKQQQLHWKVALWASASHFALKTFDCLLEQQWWWPTGLNFAIKLEVASWATSFYCFIEWYLLQNHRTFTCSAAFCSAFKFSVLPGIDFCWLLFVTAPSFSNCLSSQWFSLIDEGWYQLAAVLNFCISNRLKKNSNSTQFIQGFWSR